MVGLGAKWFPAPACTPAWPCSSSPGHQQTLGKTSGSSQGCSPPSSLSPLLCWQDLCVCLGSAASVFLQLHLWNWLVALAFKSSEPPAPQLEIGVFFPLKDPAVVHTAPYGVCYACTSQWSIDPCGPVAPSLYSKHSL